MELYWHPNAVCFLLALRNEEKIVSLQYFSHFFMIKPFDWHGKGYHPSVVCQSNGFIVKEV
nr:MAG TPA: hypothetical protein [Caudoviricetes sp.]